MYCFDGFQNFDPLLAILAPWMIHEKLTEVKAAGASYVSQLAGFTPPVLAPFDPNREVVRAFQLDPEAPLEEVLLRAARRWAGPEEAAELVAIWREVQQAIRAFPPPGLYATWGMGWYKLWTRPLVPNIDAIPESERAYYEDHLLATPHNPNRVDLNMDILFDLGGKELAQKIVERTDERVLPAVESILKRLQGLAGEASPEAPPLTVPGGRRPRPASVFRDLYERVWGLRCWLVTQRNVQAWIADVHGYLDASGPEDRSRHRDRLRATMEGEIENVKSLIELWKSAATTFMAVSDVGESTHMYGDKIADQLRTKIRLMKEHMDDEPFIDPSFLWRVPGIDFYDMTDPGPGVSPVMGSLEEV